MQAPTGCLGVRPSQEVVGDLSYTPLISSPPSLPPQPPTIIGPSDDNFVVGGL